MRTLNPLGRIDLVSWSSSYDAEFLKLLEMWAEDVPLLWDG